MRATELGLVSCLVSPFAVVACGRAVVEPVQPPPTPPVHASASASASTVAPAATSAPVKPSLAIRQVGDELVCEGEGRCRFGVRGLSAELQVKELESGAVVEYGSGPKGIGGPRFAALLRGLEQSPNVLGDEKSGDQVGTRIPLRVRFRDGAVAEGKVALNVANTRLLLNAGFVDEAGHPIEMPNDSPHAGKPRAMWVAGGEVRRQPYGSASTFAELDWILVVDDVARKVSCPTGNSVSLSDTRARVYDRRTGNVVGERVFPESLPMLELCRGDSFLTLRSAEAPADWAWGQLRASVKDP